VRAFFAFGEAVRDGGAMTGEVWVDDKADGWGTGSPRVDIAWGQ
jgi:hypothetical protein